MRSFCAKERGLTLEGPGSTSPGRSGLCSEADRKMGGKNTRSLFLTFVRYGVGSQYSVKVKAMRVLEGRGNNKEKRGGALNGICETRWHLQRVLFRPLRRVSTNENVVSVSLAPERFAVAACSSSRALHGREENNARSPHNSASFVRLWECTIYRHTCAFSLGVLDRPGGWPN